MSYQAWPETYEVSVHPYLGLFPLHDSHAWVGGPQVNANDCALHSFWPAAYTHIIIRGNSF